MATTWSVASGESPCPNYDKNLIKNLHIAVTFKGKQHLGIVPLSNLLLLTIKLATFCKQMKGKIKAASFCYLKNVYFLKTFKFTSSVINFQKCLDNCFISTIVKPFHAPSFDTSQEFQFFIERQDLFFLLVIMHNLVDPGREKRFEKGFAQTQRNMSFNMRITHDRNSVVIKRNLRFSCSNQYFSVNRIPNVHIFCNLLNTN